MVMPVPTALNITAYVVSNRPPSRILLTERAERVLIGTRRRLGDGSWCRIQPTSEAARPMAVADACTAAARAASLGLLSIPSLSRRTRRKDSPAAGNSRLGSAQVWSSQPSMLRARVAAPARPARSRSAPGCPAGCRAPRSACSSFAVNWASSLGTSSVARWTITWSLPAAVDLVVRPLLLGLHVHFRAGRFVRVSTQMPPSGQINPGRPNLFLQGFNEVGISVQACCHLGSLNACSLVQEVVIPSAGGAGGLLLQQVEEAD